MMGYQVGVTTINYYRLYWVNQNPMEQGEPRVKRDQTIQEKRGIARSFR